MVQIYLKIKKYKAVAGRMRRRGTRNEYDEEGDMPADLPYFDMLDSVIDSRAAVTPVHLLDTATADVGEL